jgi:diguanylate cyclase (GGDEF)-like protein
MAAFAHPDELPALKESFRRLLTGEIPVLHTELRIMRPDGQTRWVDMTTSLLHDDRGRPIMRLSQMLDIDARKRSEQQLRHMADHDPLSWLFNRRRFLDELAGELTASERQGSRGAVLAIDLDGFKQVNDRAGHAVGDEVIKTVSLALVRRLRSGDAAGRMGGDEFGVLLRRVTPEDAIVVSHDLLEAVSEALSLLDHEVAREVTLSIGIAVIDGSEASADVLLERADAAMYEAKRDGGGRVALSESVLTAV